MGVHFGVYCFEALLAQIDVEFSGVSYSGSGLWCSATSVFVIVQARCTLVLCLVSPATTRVERFDIRGTRCSFTKECRSRPRGWKVHLTSRLHLLAEGVERHLE